MWWDKCNKRINLLKVPDGYRSGADKETKLIVYRGLIRPCLEYGSEVYDSTCKTHKEKLDRIQSQCLFIYLGALQCTPVAGSSKKCIKM